jgi:putative phage-type endonuclease
MILANEPREVIEYTTEEAWLEQRLGDITSTEVSALFGASPYETEFSLWHRKRNREHSPYIENERTLWGKRLQDSIATGIGEDNGWTVTPMTEYIRIPRFRAGSSFDWRIADLDGVPALLEIKNVDGIQFAQKWDKNDEEGYIEGPPHIELQVQYQLLVAGVTRAVIGVLVGGNTHYALHREALPDVQNDILAAVSGFWRSIEAGIEPKPDYERDYARIAELHRAVTETKQIRIEDETFDAVCEAYQQAGQAIKANQLIHDACRARIMEYAGDAKVAMSSDWRVSSWEIKASEYTVTRRPGRGMRITKRS